jgi:hypothetical protein
MGRRIAPVLAALITEADNSSKKCRDHEIESPS